VCWSSGFSLRRLTFVHSTRRADAILEFKLAGTIQGEIRNDAARLDYSQFANKINLADKNRR
jgi:hypothetical protein